MVVEPLAFRNDVATALFEERHAAVELQERPPQGVRFPKEPALHPPLDPPFAVVAEQEFPAERAHQPDALELGPLRPFDAFRFKEDLEDALQLGRRLGELAFHNRTDGRLRQLARTAFAAQQIPGPLVGRNGRRHDSIG